MSADWSMLLGGLACGVLAGFAAQFGRLCSYAAIEDVITAGDTRRAKSWALAVAVAIVATQGLVASGVVDLTGNPYAHARIELGGLIAGAVLFGLGMSLVGTCGFGVLVRAGTGDLRAAIAALVIGIAAFAATGGLLAGPRLWLSGLFVLDAGAGATFGELARQSLGPRWAPLPAVLLPMALGAFALAGARFRSRPRMFMASLLLGLAVSGGWLVTSGLGDPFGQTRPESLTFVAPLGRTVLVMMGQTLGQSAFAVASVVGVLIGALLVAGWRGDLRWEAFDDQREMRRHLLGAVLMGLGGVLARGCTIGQGLSAASTLAVTAPIAVLSMIAGARLGLYYLIEGRSILGTWFDRLRGIDRRPSAARRAASRRPGGGGPP